MYLPPESFLVLILPPRARQDSNACGIVYPAAIVGLNGVIGLLRLAKERAFLLAANDVALYGTVGTPDEIGFVVAVALKL